MITVMNAQTNMLNRRELSKRAVDFGLRGAIALFVISELSANAAPAETAGSSGDNQKAVTTNPLKPPAKGDIPVAFIISDGAVVIDFCGPWEVFRDVMVSGGDHTFRLYTVSYKTDTFTVGG